MLTHRSSQNPLEVTGWKGQQWRLLIRTRNRQFFKAPPPTTSGAGPLPQTRAGFALYIPGKGGSSFVPRWGRNKVLKTNSGLVSERTTVGEE